MTKARPLLSCRFHRTSFRARKILTLLLLAGSVTSFAGQQPGPLAAQPSASTTQPASATKTAAAPVSVVSAQAPASAPLTGLALAPIAGLNPDDRSKDILAHLSTVIRYYRMAVSPIQKVGEPSDALYRDQAATQAAQVADYAFDSAKAEALLLDAYQKKRSASQDAAVPQQGEAQRLQTTKQTVTTRIADLKTLAASLDQQIAAAKPKDVAALTHQRDDVEGALELSNAMSDALGKIVGMSDAQGKTGLAGDIDRLQRSAPELAAAKGKSVAPPLASLDIQRSSGVTSEAVALFQLLSTRHAIDQWIQETQDLHNETLALRTPLTNILRSTLQMGDTLSQQVQGLQAAVVPDTQPAATPAPPSAPGTPAAPVTSAAIRKSFDQVTATFKALSNAAVPLSQEIILLEQSRANLLAWRAAVNDEYHEVLRALLLRLLTIALVLGVVFILGEVWKRATVRYVRDPRRRRQIMSLRRLVVGFLTGLVIIFGFVTQFNSLTTFAGFITAGLAVGLQTILLSVAAYFFIVGRYGVRVGDRISVAGVSGDVIDVGLVRFYIMELAGTGTDLHPTGRVAVFSNSVLFQAGTPLYKQLPGTEYAWHELTVKLSLTSDYNGASEDLLKAVKAVYEGYRPQIEAQHKEMEAWMDSTVDAPVIESRLQLISGGLQFSARFPVEIRNASRVDEQVTESVLKLMDNDARVKAAVTETPAIKAAVQG
ncbi:mechanosensitive ion channel family protein [Granulicella sibirica]|nr:mechanosensitive ion channel family protein [Granulicella sibirica]